MMKESEVRLKIQLNEKHVPEKMEWSATDLNDDALQHTKAFLLSVWDDKAGDTMKLDLWTSEMRIDEMDKLFFQTLLSLAETYKRSTNNDELSTEIRNFAFAFGEKTKLIRKSED